MGRIGKRPSPKTSRAGSAGLEPTLPRIDYEATVLIPVKETKARIDRWDFGELRSELGRVPTAREVVNMMLNAEHDTDKAEVTIIKLGSFVPHSCIGDNGSCDNNVAFMVNGERMCQKHMIKEIEKGEKPVTLPLPDDEKGTWEHYDPDKPLPGTEPPAEPYTAIAEDGEEAPVVAA